MKKSRGQALTDFVVLAVLAVGIIILGVYKFGDNIANYFASNDVETKFNSGRTVKHENPQDLVSNVTVTFQGITITPPVENVIKSEMSAGNYIQTSGSAGRMLSIAKIMAEYTDQIDQLITATAEGNALKTALGELNNTLADPSTGYISKLSSHVSSELLESKLEVLRNSTSSTLGSNLSNIETTLSAYLPTISGTVRHDIVETMTQDLLKTSKTVNYNIDPYLYVQYLKQDKNNTKAQDSQLVQEITTQAGSMTSEQKANIAGMISIYYGGGYSSSSPTAYNGKQMCATFGGTEIDNPAYPASDPNQYLCEITGP